MRAPTLLACSEDPKHRSKCRPNVEEHMQTLSVRGFLGIKDATIELESLTLLIGPQASGKSVIARLMYFFNQYFADFDEIPLAKSEHKKTYDKRKKDEFYQIFPTYSWEEHDFEIKYDNVDHQVIVTSGKNSSVIEVSTSESVAKYFRELKTTYKRFSENVSDNDSSLLSSSRVLREFRRAQEELNVPRYESALFVPAARSFYATIRDEIFSILALDAKIDRIILQFGDFYEAEKTLRLRYERAGAQRPRQPEDSYFDKVVKGRYERSDGRDWIVMPRGKIELSKASSGQQEAVPLLFALSRFPRPGRTLIIEEPEAHLFPDAQVDILDFIVRQAVARRTSMLFTTHSPYLLSALNNYLLRGSRGLSRAIEPMVVRSYAVGEGVAVSIVDAESALISSDYIDSVSARIEKDFIEALEKQVDEE